jgi:hypothetical protein
MSSIHSNNIYNYIKAKSPRGLRLAMLKRNAELGAFIKYFDIQFVNGSWYAWFEMPPKVIEDSL